MPTFWERLSALCGFEKQAERRARRPRVEIYGKADCCLCERAKEQLQRLQAKLDFELAEIDIAADEELLARYGSRIPLITIAGRTAFKFHLDEREFERKLRRLQMTLGD